MPSKQHEQWKHDLYHHLDRKLGGCVSCEFGETPESHSPTHRWRQHDPSQRILWTCERMHPHMYDLLRGAGSVVMEKQQEAPNSGKCRPDITILNTHREPMAFIEVVRSNRPTNSVRVAEELGIPLFTILAPNRKSLVPGLHPSRPWWELDPSLSEDARDNMRFMEQAAEEVMRRHQAGDSTWSELDMTVDDDGRLVFASFRGSEPDLAGPSFPRTGNLIVAEVCSWDCDTAMRAQQRDWQMDQLSAQAAMERQLAQNLGRILLDAIRGATDKTARFVVPVGTEEVHVEMGLRPLSTGDVPPFVLDLQAELSSAVERAKNRYRRNQLGPQLR